LILDELPFFPGKLIVVQFNADVADGMPWKFVPTQREVCINLIYPQPCRKYVVFPSYHVI